MIKLINFISDSINNYENINNSSDEQIDWMIKHNNLNVFISNN